MPILKLIRDRVPEVIREAGLDPRFRAVPLPDERRVLLFRTLGEMASEFCESAFNVDQMKRTSVDMLEVIDRIFELHDIKPEDIAEARKEKTARLGNFSACYTVELPHLEDEISNHGAVQVQPHQLPEGDNS